MKRVIQTAVLMSCLFFLFVLWLPKKSVDSVDDPGKMKHDFSKQSELWRNFVIKQIGFDIE